MAQIIKDLSKETFKGGCDYNDFDVTQTGLGGTFGHSLYVNLTGTLNTITTQQYGASETVININSAGSNGTFNIKTGH